nr:MAG TPA: hypothetical protein [Caudoviricetes sp.]
MILNVMIMSAIMMYVLIKWMIVFLLIISFIPFFFQRSVGLFLL